MKSAPIVTAALLYDDPISGQTQMLVINQAIYIKGLEHDLICPMQLRYNGIEVNERPKHCTVDPKIEDHAIILEDGKEKIHIALQLHGIVSYFPTRTPEKDEADELYRSGDYLELTASFPEWDPHSSKFEQRETRLVDRYGRLLESHLRQVSSLQTEMDIVEPFRSISAMKSTKRPGAWNAEMLAKAWGIGIVAAERTLRATTRRGVREYDGKTVGVERRFPSGNRPLRYKRLNHSLYHDTLFSTVESSKGNKCSQVYATDFGWSRNFPIKKKGDAHHTLDDLFHRYGVPTSLISDDVKELIAGTFASKARKLQSSPM